LKCGYPVLYGGARIREFNDNLRRTFLGGKVMMTAGVNALPDDVKAVVLQSARAFDAFDTENDPHCEHDFGAFEQAGGAKERFVGWQLGYGELVA
jgi:hypothetical protein